MIDLEQKLLRLARIMAYPSNKVQKDHLIGGLATTRMENKAALESLEYRKLIRIEGESVYITDKAA